MTTGGNGRGQAGAAIERLLVVQVHDTHIRGLEREMKDIPARRKEEEARLTEHRQAMAATETSAKEKTAAIKQLEAENEARREKIAKFRRQQMEIKTNREFRAIEDEIKAVEHEIAGTEDSELRLMEALDGVRSEAVDQKASLATEETAVAADQKAWDERIRQLEADLAQVRETRRQAAEGIDAAWLKSYETIFDRKAPAIVPLEDGFCGGCHMQLPPYVIHDSRKKDALVSCSFCGRIIYWR
jgi:predicted  nucleic acid-binding Zn-ribbon protein